MNTIAEPINTSLETLTVESESKINHLINDAVELLTMWAIAATSIIVLGTAWI